MDRIAAIVLAGGAGKRLNAVGRGDAAARGGPAAGAGNAVGAGPSAGIGGLAATDGSARADGPGRANGPSRADDLAGADVPGRADGLARGGTDRGGGIVKPAVPVGGIRMIDRVLAALEGAEPIVVVGPEDLGLPAAVVRTREDPPGGGPVAGLGAAIELASAPLVAILGGDLPLLTAGDLADLVRSLHPDVDGAVFVDDDDRAQWLCGVWRTDVVHARLREFAAERGGLANGSLRGLFGPLRFAEVRAGNRVMPPFFDCDTDDDIRRAEEWLRR